MSMSSASSTAIEAVGDGVMEEDLTSKRDLLLDAPKEPPPLDPGTN